MTYALWVLSNVPMVLLLSQETQESRTDFLYNSDMIGSAMRKLLSFIAKIQVLKSGLLHKLNK